MSNTPIQVAKVTLVSSQAMTSNITTSSVAIDEIISFAAHCYWSGGGTPVGSLILQGSLDDSNYADLSTSPVSGNSGSIMFNVERAGYSYFRIHYVFTSGNANLTVKYNLKRV